MVRLPPAWLYPNAPRPHLRSSFLIDMVFHVLLRTVFTPFLASLRLYNVQHPV